MLLLIITHLTSWTNIFNSSSMQLRRSRCFRFIKHTFILYHQTSIQFLLHSVVLGNWYSQEGILIQIIVVYFWFELLLISSIKSYLRVGLRSIERIIKFILTLFTKSSKTIIRIFIDFIALYFRF